MVNINKINHHKWRTTMHDEYLRRHAKQPTHQKKLKPSKPEQRDEWIGTISWFWYYKIDLWHVKVSDLFISFLKSLRSSKSQFRATSYAQNTKQRHSGKELRNLWCTGPIIFLGLIKTQRYGISSSLAF